MLVFFALFVYLGAAMEFAAATGRTLTHGIPVRAAMITEFHTLEHGKTIRDAANLMLATSQQDFPIVHGDKVVGLLGRNLLLKALAAEGPEAYVAGVMDRDFLAIEPGDDLAEVLPLMAQAGRCALVMEGDKLVGLLTTENLSEFWCCGGLGWSRRRSSQEPVGASISVARACRRAARAILSTFSALVSGNGEETSTRMSMRHAWRRAPRRKDNSPFQPPKKDLLALGLPYARH